MFRNYLIVAIRNLNRYRVYSAINIAGLAIGMAGVILIALFIQFELSYDAYHEKYLEGRHMVVATTDKVEVNEQVYHDCRARTILVNVADNPPFCDFYMGGIVTKGNVKVAISTNGKSPTTAKRLRQFFEDVIPENIDDLVQNLNEYRKTIKGDFEEKVETLNEFTKGLVSKKGDNEPVKNETIWSRLKKHFR